MRTKSPKSNWSQTVFSGTDLPLSVVWLFRLNRSVLFSNADYRSRSISGGYARRTVGDRVAFSTCCSVCASRILYIFIGTVCVSECAWMRARALSRRAAMIATRFLLPFSIIIIVMISRVLFALAVAAYADRRISHALCIKWHRATSVRANAGSRWPLRSHERTRCAMLILLYYFFFVSCSSDDYSRCVIWGEYAAWRMRAMVRRCDVLRRRSSASNQARRFGKIPD